jgi:hypothetical protein
VDPLYQSYPWNSTYAFAENRCIDGVDIDGGEFEFYLLHYIRENYLKPTPSDKTTWTGAAKAFGYTITGAVDPIGIADNMVAGAKEVYKQFKKNPVKTAVKALIPPEIKIGMALAEKVGEAWNGDKVAGGTVAAEAVLIIAPFAATKLCAVTAAEAATTPSAGLLESSACAETEAVITETSEVVTYYRTQGGVPPNASKNLISVSEEGSVNVKSSTLNVSTGSNNHAEYFATKRGQGTEIVQFDIPKWMDDMIEEYAIPQPGYRSNPANQNSLAPKIVDPTTPGRSYELPSVWSEWINENAIQGSGKVTVPN